MEKIAFFAFVKIAQKMNVFFYIMKNKKRLYFSHIKAKIQS